MEGTWRGERGLLIRDGDGRNGEIKEGEEKSKGIGRTKGGEEPALEIKKSFPRPGIRTFFQSEALVIRLNRTRVTVAQ